MNFIYIYSTLEMPCSITFSAKNAKDLAFSGILKVIKEAHQEDFFSA